MCAQPEAVAGAKAAKVANTVAKFDSERRTKLERLVGQSFLETMLAAQENACPLYSDDFGTRSFAEQEFEASGFWSQALIIHGLESGQISQDAADEAFMRLVLLRYKHTTITGAALLAAARRSEWTNSGPFARMIEALSDPDAEIRSTLGVIAEFAVLLWRQPILDMRRESLFRAALDGIRNRGSESRNFQCGRGESNSHNLTITRT